MSTFHEGVDPVRLASMLERKSVLVRYCAIKRPSGAQTARYAKELGMSTGGFYRLAKEWRVLPELKGMGGASVKPDRTPKLSIAVMRIVEEIIEIRDSGSSVRKIHDAICDRCRLEGLDLPTLSAVHERVMKARTSAEAVDRTRRFSAFQCRVDLPVDDEGGIRAPYLTGIIDLPSKRIINTSIAFGSPVSLAVAIRSLLHNRRRLQGTPLVVAPTRKLAELSKELDYPLGPAGREYAAPALLGRRIKTLPILHRSYPGADEKLAKKVIGRMNSALSKEEAIVQIKAAIEAHNDERGGL